MGRAGGSRSPLGQGEQVYSALAAMTLPILLTFQYAWLPPPVSNLMIARLLGGEGIDYRWRPLPAISPELAKAVVTSEDARFCEHEGIDWGASPGDRREVPRWGRAAASGGQHYYHANGQEPLSLGREVGRPEGVRSASGLVDRCGLAQTAGYRGLSQHRGVGPRDLWGRGSRTATLRQECIDTDPKGSCTSRVCSTQPDQTKRRKTFS